MNSLFTLPNCLVLALLLVFIGCYGIFVRKSLIMILLSVEIMLNGVHLSLISFNYFVWGSSEQSHYLYMLSIGVAAVEAAIGLSMIVTLFRNNKDISRDRIAKLGERE